MTSGHSDIITGDVFAGKLARLRDVWLDPAPVFDEVGIERFVGRKWLITAIDQFVASRDRGYLVIRGDAGIGKSTFAAWLARERGWACHFTRRRNGRVSVVALRNLAAQLIAWYSLADRFAPGGVLPETSGEPGWFDQVLRAAAREAGNKLVIVVDGLDEAEHVQGDLPLGLPAALPKGAFVIATCRTGTDLPSLRQPWQPLMISAQDRQNTSDLRRFIALRAGEKPIATALTRADISAKQLVRRLVRNTRGIWVYARYVLDEIAFGMRSPADLDRLPVDLAHYYAESLAPIVRGSGLPLLATLSVAVEPLSIESLTKLSGLGSPTEVRRLCIGALRPFLVSHDDHRYGIYHHSLREYLTGTGGYELAQAEELRAATFEAHDRIASTYLAEFGGLGGLPALAADPGLGRNDGGYPLRYLTRHLESSTRISDLHTLLSAETATRNVWFEAHNAAGTLDDYLADLSRGTHHARLATNDQVTSGHPATGLGLEVRYALMAASVVTLTARVGVPLLVRLVTADVWTADRAVAHARQLHDVPTRVTALLELVPHLPEARRSAVVAEAIVNSRTMRDLETKARALAKAAAHLPQRQAAQIVAEALKAAEGVEVEAERADALSALVSVLPGCLGEQALALASTIEDTGRRAVLLTELIPVLPQRLSPDVFRMLQPFEDGWDRLTVLKAMAEWLPADEIPELLALTHDLDLDDQIYVMVQTGIPDVVAKALELAREPSPIAVLHLFPHLDASTRGEMVLDALRKARREESVHLRILMLKSLALHLPPETRQEVLRTAIADLDLIEDQNERADLAVSLTPHLHEDDVVTLLSSCRTLTENLPRVHVVLGVADHLPDGHRRRLHEEVLKDILSMAQRDERILALCALVERLHETLMETALKEIRSLAEDYARPYLINLLAPRLPRDLLREALSIAQLSTDDDARAELVASLARHRSGPAREELFLQALTIARDTTFRGDRSATLRRIAAATDEPLRSELLNDAVTAGREYSTSYDRAWSLMLTARLMSEPQRTAVHLEALDNSRSIEDAENRAWTRCRVGAQLPQPERDEVLLQVADAARDLENNFFKTMLLGVIAAMISAPHRVDMLDQARQAALSFASANHPLAAVLGRVVRYVPERLQVKLLDAVRVVYEASSEWPTAGVPTAKIASLIELLPHRLVLDAIGATPHMPHHYPVEAGWAVLALHLRGTLREAALGQVFGSTGAAVLARTVLLVQARSVWQSAVGVAELDVVRRALANLDVHKCHRIIAVALPVLRDAGGDTVISDCLHTMNTLQRWWRPADPEPLPAPVGRGSVQNIVNGPVTGKVFMIGQVNELHVDTGNLGDISPS